MNIHEAGSGEVQKQFPAATVSLDEAAAAVQLQEDEEKTLVCCVQLTYVGFSVVSWRSTKALLNWVIGDRFLFTRSQHQPVHLYCYDRFFRAEDANDGQPVFLHPISGIYQITRGRDGLGLAYITHNESRDRFYCHAFAASSHDLIATVHDAWSNSGDRVKNSPKSMDLLSLIPAEKQGLLTLSTALHIEEHSFPVRYLGQMSTTASTGSSSLVDKVIEAALNKQKEQQRKRQQIIKEGRLQQSRREMQLQRKSSQELQLAEERKQDLGQGQDDVDGVVSDIIASTTSKVKEVQEAVAVSVKKEPSSNDGSGSPTTPKDIPRTQSATAKTRFFNLIRRSGSGSSVPLTTAGDSPTTASDQKTDDGQRSQADSHRLSPSSSNEAVLPDRPSPRWNSDGKRRSSLKSSPEIIRSPMDDVDAVRELSKCSSRASNGTESTLTASAGPPPNDSGDSGVSAASTPEGDRILLRAPSASILSDNSSTWSDSSETHCTQLNHRAVNLCISAESIRFYGNKRARDGGLGEENGVVETGKMAKYLCWERKLSSISYCAKGMVHSTCWCLIVSESPSKPQQPQPGVSVTPNFVCYLFSCQTEDMTISIMEAITKSFKVAFELHQNPPVTIQSPFCEACPTYIMHQLCVQVNSAMHVKAAQAFAAKTAESLPKEDRAWLSERLQSLQQFSEDVQLQITMGLLRGIFDRLQTEHSHSDGEKPMEIDDSDEAICKPRLGALSRAKRTLANSIEGLRKKEKPAPSPAAPRSAKRDSPSSSMRRKTYGNVADHDVDIDSHTQMRHPSLPAINIPGRSSPRRSPATTPPGTPTLSVPLRTPPSLRRRNPRSPTRKQSFRHSIYKNAHATPGGTQLSPSKETNVDDSDDDDEGQVSPLLSPRRQHASSPCARGLWKRAIDEQIMLVRLEKASQHVYDEKELEARRLAYNDMLEQSEQERLTHTWLQLLPASDSEEITATKADVRKALADGVPKLLRGRVWKLLTVMRCASKTRRPDAVDSVDGRSAIATGKESASFEDLRNGSTTFLHAIIIDLGRTFPGHEYFQSAAGPGQCSLFHVLRAYANLDEDVGYCQGLSFVVGLLVMHADGDSNAFQVLQSLMYDVDLRGQYKPDMARLQVRLYQLSRLLHDFQPKVHQLFEKHDVAPFFYAAPWFLTLFSSQYPLYFASRAMDLILLDGVDAIFKISVTLLRHAESQLLSCVSFEQILDCMKIVLPAIGARVPDVIVREAMQLNIHEKLRTFEVEHSVLQDLDSSQTMSGDLEAANIALKAQHTDLIQQLALARGSALRLQDALNELTLENRQLVQQADSSAAQMADLRRTVEQLQEQLAAQAADKDAAATRGSEEVDGGAPPFLPVKVRQRKVASNLRRRSSVPAFPLTRPLIQRRYQWSFDDLAEVPVSKLEDFFADARLDSLDRY